MCGTLDEDLTLKYFLYRPVLAGKLTLTEIKTIATLDEVLEINALLDMEADIAYQQHLEAERKSRK